MNWADVIDTKALDKALYWVKEEREFATIYPEAGLELTAFELTPFEEVKVVIMGQDPYPGTDHYGEPHAHGLAFSSRSKETPSSLKNIFKEIKNEYNVPRFNNDLSDWATQGVLLLNTALTVEEGQPGSHSELWCNVIKSAVTALSNYHSHLVFMLWGQEALQVYPWLRPTKYFRSHLILEASHPSPLSAHRGFLGCQHFQKANSFLRSQDKTIIKWFD